ncbi:DUF7519 family protein [Candidatus Halobonum tyrrellensis]|uniref:DUF7519 family protein n=1 Tax=Candidatus Halobonum tyrrellensis TaxID=1431545 RepID=UPI00126922E6|nr:hypothetical protein [Candidatus Halobonum tyrrellensis]
MSSEGRPGRLGLLVALAAGGLAAGTLAAAGFVPPALLSVVATGSLAVGAARPARRPVSLGGLALGLGVVLAGLLGASALPLLVATGAGALAYDAADRAATLRAGSRPTTDTRDAEATGSLLALVVVLVAGGGAYLATLAVGEGSPLAVFALLAGGVVLTLAVGRPDAA